MKFALLMIPCLSHVNFGGFDCNFCGEHRDFKRILLWFFVNFPNKASKLRTCIAIAYRCLYFICTIMILQSHISLACVDAVCLFFFGGGVLEPIHLQSRFYFRLKSWTHFSWFRDICRKLSMHNTDSIEKFVNIEFKITLNIHK